MGSGRLFSELAALLSERNGFYAFESALHVFGSGSDETIGGSVERWNALDGWISQYDGLADGLAFFAEDIFGTQFAIRDEQILTFDPETGAARKLAPSIDDWSHQLMSNFEYLTGHPVARRWQLMFGSLIPGNRLVPKTPFVLGGEFEPSNLESVAASEGMRERARLAVATRDVPDGSTIRWRRTR